MLTYEVSLEAVEFLRDFCYFIRDKVQRSSWAAELTQKTIAEINNRKRPWIA
ncbi:MAG: hypothetical protein JSV82_01700 [Planctomycetota bacterium]|nr:MAG: hypothetical protein JSV82_01700 [Planctomycetota bacterium]